jgi:chromosome segregation ATPase
LIAQLQPLIKNASDATIIVPLIKEYLDVAVKNDDHLVKLTAIVQRYISTKQTISGADGLLSDEEKQQLLKVAETTLASELEDEIDRIEEDDKILQQKIADVKNKLEKDVND